MAPQLRCGLRVGAAFRGPVLFLVLPLVHAVAGQPGDARAQGGSVVTRELSLVNWSGVSEPARSDSRELSLRNVEATAPSAARPVGRAFSLVTSPASAEPLGRFAAREFSLANRSSLVGPSSPVPSRELSAYNDANPPVSLNAAHSRILSRNTTDAAAYRLFGGARREVAEFNWIGTPCAVVNSDLAGLAFLVSGTLSQQLATLNAGPPAAAAPGGPPGLRRNDNATDEAFRCPEVPNPAGGPYVSAAHPLPEGDEVTYDNCGSAFYRRIFELPNPFTVPVLIGRVSADDQVVIFLNGRRISRAMTDPGCQPGPTPTDPCYDLQDTGNDWTGAAGRCASRAGPTRPEPGHERGTSVRSPGGDGTGPAGPVRCRGPRCGDDS